MINIFKLEEYLSRYEFNAPYLLCCSDAESFRMEEIIQLASPSDLEKWNNLRLGYTEVWGMPELRQQINISLYPSIDTENILCFAGAEDAIFCTLKAICRIGDHAIVLSPCYQSLLELPKHNGCTITEIPLLEENQWRIDLESIRYAIQPNTKCIIINFPHNPTGQIITPEELTDLVAICRQQDVWLFSDEVYRLLGQPANGIWAAPAVTLYEKAISLGVMSKAFGLAGLRVGWIACQDTALLESIVRIKHYTTICNSGPAEVLSLIALRNMDTLLDRNNKIVADNLSLLDSFFEKYSNLFSWVRPQGGCVGFVKYTPPSLQENNVANMPISTGPETTIDSFCEELVKVQGVLLLPASVYDAPTSHFRIGFGRLNMAEALQKFSEFINVKFPAAIP